MNSNNQLKIKQIISAQRGWKAVHCTQSESGQVAMSERAIVCWALVEQNESGEVKRTEVRGMEQRFDDLIVVGDIIKAVTISADDIDRNEYFLGYDDPDAHRESQYWIGEADRRLKREKEQRGAK
jgi:hypothetical protein